MHWHLSLTLLLHCCLWHAENRSHSLEEFPVERITNTWDGFAWDGSGVPGSGRLLCSSLQQSWLVCPTVQCWEHSGFGITFCSWAQRATVMLRALSWLKGLSTSVGVGGHCCTAETRAARLISGSVSMSLPRYLPGLPAALFTGHLYCHCLCFLRTGPWGCATLSLCSVHLDVIVLALHLEQSVNLQPRNSCRRPGDCITY